MKKLAISAAVCGIFAYSSAWANPRIVDVQVQAILEHEKVEVKIAKDVAEVNGVYKFKNDSRDFVNLMVYLPVYAAEGTPEEAMRPQFKMGDDQVLHARFVKSEWEAKDENIKSFGELPQLSGQRVYWYLVPYVPQQPNQTELTLKISYKQQLSDGKFIYTPLIPEQKKDKDYGSITVSADRKLTLLDSEKHSFVEEKGKYTVEPSDKRAIVVELAKAKSNLP